MRPRRGPQGPLIGVTPDTRGNQAAPSRGAREPVIFLQQRYLRAILEAGGIPLLLPIAPSRAALHAIVDRLDGIVVSGGNFDIHPRLYGEEAIPALGKIQEERTEFELELISLALRRDRPLLGICGGAQAINVALGGSLYQDISSQLPGARAHERGDLKERGGHRVEIYDGTKLRRILGRKTLEVNTTHHQAVKRPGKGLIVNAAAEDGVIEGIESRELSFVIGVQWHPEFLIGTDPHQRKILVSFVSACKAPES